MTFQAGTKLVGNAPYAADLDLAVARARLFLHGDAALDLPAAKVHVGLRDAYVDLARPAASRASLDATLGAGDLTASLEAKKGDDALDFTLRAAATSLRMVRAFVPAGLRAAIAWDPIALEGEVERARRPPLRRLAFDRRVDRDRRRAPLLREDDGGRAVIGAPVEGRCRAPGGAARPTRRRRRD